MTQMTFYFRDYAGNLHKMSTYEEFVKKIEREDTTMKEKNPWIEVNDELPPNEGWFECNSVKDDKPYCYYYDGNTFWDGDCEEDPRYWRFQQKRGENVVLKFGKVND